jgi:triose/dihydroxyacetone kinase / FAD-AMP lyase (cyclizing)
LRTGSALNASRSPEHQQDLSCLGDCTLIDAISPALDAYDKGFAAAASAARVGAKLTATYLSARAGRAAYINARQLEGHIDPGAEAI